MGMLEIGLFGTPTLQRDGQPLARFPSRKVRDLLAYLLVNRHVPHPREQLAGVFWGDWDDRKARHCLNTTLWRLRRVIGPSQIHEVPYLHVDAQTIGFNTASNFRLDIAEFEDRCTWAEGLGQRAPEYRAALYRQAITLYQGDLLTDCYQEWCLVERERLQRLYLRALSWLLAYHMQRGEHDAAIECGSRILASDPLLEEVHRDLIQLHLDAQQSVAALRQYRACEEVLRRELGVAPMPETQALLARIIATTGPAGPVGTCSTGAAPPVVKRNLAGDLMAAMTRLYEVVGTLDQARDQLCEAITLIEATVRQLGKDIVHDQEEARVPEASLAQFGPAIELVAEVVRRLERGTAPGLD